MQYQKLENIKSKHPNLRKYIDALAQYIDAEMAEGRTRIIPALAAGHLKLSEAETLGLLMLFEDAGLLHAEYDVVCPNTKAVLATVQDKSELRRLFPIHCEFDDTDHNADDVLIELVFEAATQAPQRNAVA